MMPKAVSSFKNNSKADKKSIVLVNGIRDESYLFFSTANIGEKKN